MTEHAVGRLGTGVVAADDLVNTVDDLGLTRGDGCFDATRVVTDADGRHRVDHLPEHLDRLAASAAALGLPPVDRAAWTALIEAVLDTWTTPGEAVLKLMLTRGREWSPAGGVTGLASVSPVTETVLRQRAEGIAVLGLNRGTAADAFADAPWLLGGVKTLSYAVNVAALRHAAANGADDVIFLSSDGHVLEGPTAAVVWYDGATLHTTPTGATGILASITQQAVFAAAGRAGLAVAYTLGTVDDLLAADGVWLVSSGRGAARVHTLDDKPLATSVEPAVPVQALAGF